MIGLVGRKKTQDEKDEKRKKAAKVGGFIVRDFVYNEALLRAGKTEENNETNCIFRWVCWYHLIHWKIHQLFYHLDSTSSRLPVFRTNVNLTSAWTDLDEFWKTSVHQEHKSPTSLNMVNIF
ncbi:unnamed protein product [Caenorhabditis angaria]|uniref:Uncharacterized protein n=1 Tax=Caenorhabditis angaria TaxID=860376 RepID=A0A9P1IUT5_9PELO|nr:unnamed protein product [Caenorhabditis angaria]